MPSSVTSPPNPPSATGPAPSDVARLTPPTAMNALAVAAPALVVALALLLPFLGKAYTLDDTLFLRQAQHLLSDPLHPTAFTYVWEYFPQRLSSIMPSGPVGAWLLVLAARAHADERVAHLSELPLLLVGLWATARLALRLGLPRRDALLATLLAATAPTLIAMGATCMPDVASMGLGALGVERAWAFRDERRVRQAVTATLALTLATLARPHTLLLLGVVALLAVHDWRRPLAVGEARAALVRNARALAPLVVLAGLLVVVTLRVTADPAAGVLGTAESASRFSGWRSVDRNVLAWSVHWLVVIPFAVPWLVARRRRARFRLALGLLPLDVLLVFTTGELARWWWIAPVATLGQLAILDALLDAWRRDDAAEVVLAAWLFVALPVAFYVHLPSKYLLPSLPAAAILSLRVLRREAPRLVVPLTALLCAWGIVLGLAILRADEAMCGLQRRAARELIAPRVARGERVWFGGHWGFQHYAEEAGARALTTTPPFPAPGDVIVYSNLTAIEILKRLPTVKTALVESWDRSPPGGRLVSKEDGAGFFYNPFGYLPWAWGTGPIDKIDVYRVVE